MNSPTLDLFGTSSARQIPSTVTSASPGAAAAHAAASVAQASAPVPAPRARSSHPAGSTIAADPAARPGTPTAARARAAQLRELIGEHNRRYYVDSDSSVSDAEFDSLKAELVRLEAAHPELLTPDSPTQRVGGTVDPSRVVVAHVAPMLSLKTPVLDSAQDELQRIIDAALAAGSSQSTAQAFNGEPKYDGVSLSAVWEYGRLARVLTRGDGAQGEDITEQARLAQGIPAHVETWREAARVEVRLEGVLPLAALARINERAQAAGSRVYANARNAASGILRRKVKPGQATSQAAEIVAMAFDFGPCDGLRLPPAHSECLQMLRDLGFRVSPLTRVVQGVEGAAKFREDVRQARSQLEFGIDGVVLKLDDRAMQARLGNRSNEPVWAMAWKFPAVRVASTLESVVFQVGRTGQITPVAKVAPVEVDGVIVTSATLVNADTLERLRVRAGDRVRVFRGGDVVPQIEGVVVEEGVEPPEQRADYVRMVATCPECGSALQRYKSETRCVAGSRCRAQLLNALEHFASRDALDIEGLAIARIEQLVERGLAVRASDLWSLRTQDLAGLDGWGEVSASKLVERVRGCRGVSLERFIFALGIPNVGKGTAKGLATSLLTWQAVAEASMLQLEAIPDIGPITAESILAWLEVEANRAEFVRLAELIEPVAVQRSATVAGGALTGKTFVITGTLSAVRADVEAMIEACGANVSGSVSKKTDFLVKGANPKSKLQKAEALGVAVIDEAELMRLLRSAADGPTHDSPPPATAAD